MDSGGDNNGREGYRLPAKFVIHTVGPVYSGAPEDALLLADCYRNSLDLARKNGVHTIAFPAISTGVYGYPVREATKVAVDTVKKWLADNPDYPMGVTFCCFDERTRKVYEEQTARI